ARPSQTRSCLRRPESSRRSPRRRRSSWRGGGRTLGNIKPGSGEGWWHHSGFPRRRWSRPTRETSPARAVCQPGAARDARRARGACPVRAGAAGEQGTCGQKEEFVAAVVVLYLGQYFAQLRQLMGALVFVPPLLLFTAASYPFQPNRPWLTSLVALLAVVAAG